MSERVLVIVESPTKARTIKRFLPKTFSVEASVGHIRDLPQNAAEIPAALKKEPWAKIGIDVDHDFAPLYVTPRGKGKVIQQLKRQVKEADMVLLATDEDREGESISWHLVQVLKPKVPVKRMVFHEITKRAIDHAVEHGRDIDMNLVNAQETRRILDRLYGYTLSPLIWKKIAYGLSAGRVQSPGLRLIVDRELERIAFKQSTYWDAKADLFRPEDGASKSFEAKLESLGGQRIAGSKDFDSITGEKKGKKSLVLDRSEAEALVERLKQGTWKVESVTEKQSRNRPAPPFITSTLQQEGNRKLRLSARNTMQAAQRLYEQGFITYMRTDSPTLSSEGTALARQAVEKHFGSKYLSKEVRRYSAKSKGAQEAHEAIRPSGETFRHPDETGLTGRDLALYSMIWKRTLATQMAEVEKATTTVKIAAEDALFTASGTRIVFPGFVRVYVEGKDDPEAALDDRESWLPKLSEGMTVSLKDLEPVPHETKPPARYTEATLVKQLEQLDIGRPSTYASIINTLHQRGYVQTQGSALVPTFTGMAVIQLLEENFQDLIEYSFTSSMEDSLDRIAEGEVNRLEYLKQFYLGDQGLKHQVERREHDIDPGKSRIIKLPQISCIDGIRIGKYGPYVLVDAKDETVHASVPEDIPPGDLKDEDIEHLIKVQKEGPKPIGYDPESGLPVFFLTGRYGPYFQLGEKSDDQPKPKRASVPKGKSPEAMELDEILKLLSLPRKLGAHPETGKDITAGIGRFGPYVSHDGEFRSVKDEQQLHEITLDEALELLARPKQGRGGVTILKELGVSSSGKKITLCKGKYGAYLKHGAKNVALPKQKKDEAAAEKLTLEEAEKIIKTGTKGTRRKRS